VNHDDLLGPAHNHGIGGCPPECPALAYGRLERGDLDGWLTSQGFAEHPAPLVRAEGEGATPALRLLGKEDSLGEELRRLVGRLQGWAETDCQYAFDHPDEASFHRGRANAYRLAAQSLNELIR